MNEYATTQVTLLLSSDPVKTKASYRGTTAKSLQIPIVALQYVLDCISVGKLLPLESYIEQSDGEKLEAGRIGTLLFLQWLFRTSLVGGPL